MSVRPKSECILRQQEEFEAIVLNKAETSVSATVHARGDRVGLGERCLQSGVGDETKLPEGLGLLLIGEELAGEGLRELWENDSQIEMGQRPICRAVRIYHRAYMSAHLQWGVCLASLEDHAFDLH